MAHHLAIMACHQARLARTPWLCMLSCRGSACRFAAAGDLPVGRFSVQPPLQKYFASPVGQITSTTAAVSSHRGALARSSRTRGGMRWTRAAQDEGAVLRTAKSGGPDASTPAARLREEAQTTVTKKPDHRGEHEVVVKTIACGNAGRFRWTCGDCARVLISFC